ncbi:hypothetical protein [Rhodococcus sp. (in: high G+C Gram-positive bacteria)]|uniref:hypothetical protein n=1 Tax=Rhodococcus sp. TaxID=1831 RepID=UPI003B8A69AF
MKPGELNSAGVAATVPPTGAGNALPETSLLQSAVEMSREIERLEVLLVAAVAEIDRRGISFDTLGFRGVEQWLAANTLMEVSDAARVLASGRMLGRQPEAADSGRQ